MTEAELAAYSYTGAAGKRPYGERDRGFLWFRPLIPTEDANELPDPVYSRLQGGMRDARDWMFYPTESAALAAADEAFRRAWREGWRQFEEVG